EDDLVCNLKLCIVRCDFILADSKIGNRNTVIGDCITGRTANDSTNPGKDRFQNGMPWLDNFLYDKVEFNLPFHGKVKRHLLSQFDCRSVTYFKQIILLFEYVKLSRRHGVFQEQRSGLQFFEDQS